MFWNGAAVRRGSCLGLSCLFAASLTPAVTADSPGPAKPDGGGLVVAVSPPGADTGRDILRRGGNAVDAAVATAFAMAVTYPAAGNIGGGGFMLIYPPAARRSPVVIDYRETAPRRRHEDHVHQERQPGTATRPSASPAPCAAWPWPTQRFGKLPWKDVVAPAVKLAEDGFVIDEPLASSLNGSLAPSPSVPPSCGASSARTAARRTGRPATAWCRRTWPRRCG